MTVNLAAKTEKRRQKKPRDGFLTEMRKNGFLYALTIPGLLFFLIFHYIPMGGLVIAFQDFNMIKGIFGSSFNGINNFKFLFGSDTILKVIGNTLYLNVLFIIATTVFSIGLAVVFSEIKQRHVKKVAQTLSILPYFISWAVIALFLEAFLKADGGILSTALANAGHPVQFYSDASVWPALLVILKVWQGAGYGSIVYIASITGIDPGIYEAANIDGATRLQKIFRITIPILRPTIILMTLFSVGRIFYGDFGMIYGLIQDNSMLFATTDVIDTYVYRMLRSMSDYGMAAAVGLLQSVFGFVFVYCANRFAKRLDPNSAIF